MASFTVFGSETPSVINGDDNDDYALGTVVLIGEAGTITHARQYFSDPLPSGPVTWRVSDLSTLDLIGSHVFASPAPGWVEEELDPPIPIVSARNVLVWHGTPDGYVYTNGKFTSAAVVSGPLTAPRSADDPQAVGNGRFGGDPGSPPVGTSGATAYFTDMVFAELPPQGSAAFALEFAFAATGEAPEITPAQGSVGFALALAPAGAGRADASSAGALAVAYQFGATGQTPAVSPAQGSAAVGLGLAPAALGGRPAGGRAAFTLGLAVGAAGVVAGGGGPRLVSVSRARYLATSTRGVGG
jgi:hypothetical protein